MDGLAAAVSIWLTVSGTPLTGPLVQESTAKAIQGEGMYGRSSREVWDHAKIVLQKAGFRPERQDNKTQILVTQWRSYDDALFPALTLEPDERVKRVQLHLMVATTHEPARVVVGSIVEVERRANNRTDTLLKYRVSPIEDWFLTALGDQIGAKHEPTAATMTGRSEQAARLASAAATCAPQAGAGVKPPVKLSDVQPVFPAEGFGSGQGKVLLQAVITEHGSMTELRVANPTQQFAHYEASARAAVSLWRYKPPSKDGCPMPMFSTVTVTYTIR